MDKQLRLRTVAVLSFLFTCAFFIEYLPPWKRVLLPYDLAHYHYPLAQYTFQALRAGHFPQWDPFIYCGSSLVGNTNAALFYPPLWIALAANLGRQGLPYQAVENLVFVHVWLAFLLCFVWLRRKGLTDLAAALGAGVFAFSGYLCEQLQHLGLVAAYAWAPLGFLGIDEAVEQRRWRPLWKVAAASALSLLAGYVPTWFVFAVCMAAYAAWRWKVLLGTAAALAASLLLAAVQLLPSWYATSLKDPELKYGAGVRNLEYVLSYLLPNYFDFGMRATGGRADQYLYLGAPALLGLLCLLRRGGDRRWLPPAIMGTVALVFMTNPYGLVWAVVKHSNILMQVCRDWYFLAGITAAVAPLAALGLDRALRARRRPVPGWLVAFAVVLLAGWAARQIVLWATGGLATGWKSALDAAVSLALVAVAVYLLPGTRPGVARAALAIALLFAAGADYKAFGTSRRVNAGEGKMPWEGSPATFYALDQEVYEELRGNAGYRVFADITGPFPQELRHFGLATPQGVDPFLTREYTALVQRVARFREAREPEIGPDDAEALRLFGVRYFITSEAAGPLYPRLSKDPHFRKLEPSESYFKVFEYLHAAPPYGWTSGTAGTVEPLLRAPERRIFHLRSESGGRFALSEQFFPGWRATVDGAPARIHPWQGAFQAVDVPAGEHRVEFRYRAAGLAPGVCVSAVALLLGAALLFRRSKM